MPILIFAIAVLFAGYILFRLLVGDGESINEKLRKKSKSSIRAVKEGEYVKLVGFIVPIAELVSPFARRHCVFYRVEVTEASSKYSNRRNSKAVLLEHEEYQNFLIDDGTGLVFINPVNFKSHLVNNKRFSSGPFNDATPPLESFLKKFNVKSRNKLGFNKDLNYFEGALEPLEKVAVMGYAKWSTAELLKLPEKFAGKKILVLDSGNEKKYLSNDEGTQQ